MSNNVNYLELVKQAQLGCQESMTRLTKLTEGSLCAYIYRLTLNYELTEELLQETLLEMVKSLKKLKFKHVNQFWAWLYRTALGKVQLHFRAQQHEKAIPMSMFNKEHLSGLASLDYNDGLSNMIRKELSDTVFEAIGKLKLRHRNVLVLRCLEQRSYSEISAIMDCSEIAAQVLFFRAKRSLKRQLSKHGFGKGFLLLALGLFARLTTPAKAAPAIPATTTSLQVGLVASIIGAIETKLGIVVGTVVTAIVLTMGGISVVRHTSNPPGISDINSISSNVNNEVFQYPAQLLEAYDPIGNGWKGIEANEISTVPVVPKEWLVGSPPSEQSSVVLPIDSWIELKYQDAIVDGPGDDILITEWGENGEQARVFITDGADNKYLLGTIRIASTGLQVPTEVGFDISGISLSFVPRAIRIIGTQGGGGTNGFDLHSVRARTNINQTNN